MSPAALVARLRGVAVGRGPGVLLGIAVALGIPGCATIPEPTSGLQEAIGGSEMSTAQLRVRVRDLADRFSGEIEALADELAAQSADPRGRIALLRFKINAIPEMQEALLRPDPVAALIDAWALLVQLQLALPEIASRGEASPAALALVARRLGELEDELAGLWSELTGNADVAATRGRIHQWASENPVGALTSRRSTVGLLSELTARSGVKPLGAAAASLLEGTQDLTQRMDLMATYLPRQARWQAELAVREALADPSLIPGGTPGDLVGSLARVLRMVEAVPALLDAEREAMLATLRAERLEMQGFVTDEREQIAALLSQERATVMTEGELSGMRLIDHAFDRASGLARTIMPWLLLAVAFLCLAAIAVALILARRGPGERRPLVTRRRREAQT